MPRRVHIPVPPPSGPQQPDDGNCFALQLVPFTGLTEREQKQLNRDLEDWASDHDLALEGDQLQYLVYGLERPLHAADQVELLNWLLEHAPVVRIRLSPLQPSGTADIARAYIEVPKFCTEAIALSMLFRLNRISPEMFLEILGGYVRPHVLH